MHFNLTHAHVSALELTYSAYLPPKAEAKALIAPLSVSRKALGSSRTMGTQFIYSDWLLTHSML